MESTPVVLEGASSALVEAVTAVAGQMTGALGDILPIALPVMGAILVVRYGMKVFKSFAK